jgi:hypothetical protein
MYISVRAKQTATSAELADESGMMRVTQRLTRDVPSRPGQKSQEVPVHLIEYAYTSLSFQARLRVSSRISLESLSTAPHLPRVATLCTWYTPHLRRERVGHGIRERMHSMRIADVRSEVWVPVTASRRIQGQELYYLPGETTEGLDQEWTYRLLAWPSRKRTRRAGV